MKKGLKTPLRYPGGKSRACGKMAQYFPNLKDYTEYREPFLGGGSVALYISQMHPHLKITVNDLYEPLMNFWSNLQMFGGELYTELQNLKITNCNQDSARCLFAEMKDVINDKSKTDLERAVAFYVVNKCSFSGLTESSSFSAQASDSNFSGFIDTIMYANEMNRYHNLDKDMQYSFYLNSVRKRKRFSPWLRKDKVNDLECVKEYYGYSNEKASQALKILDKTQLNFIKQRLETGGTQ